MQQEKHTHTVRSREALKANQAKINRSNSKSMIALQVQLLNGLLARYLTITNIEGFCLHLFAYIDVVCFILLLLLLYLFLSNIFTT